MPKTPNLVPVLHRIQYITLERRFDAIKADAIVSAAHERHVFSVRPAQGHGRTRRTAAFHPGMRQIISVPELFSDHPTGVSKVFYCYDEQFWIPPRSQLVMATFSSQDRPA